MYKPSRARERIRFANARLTGFDRRHFDLDRISENNLLSGMCVRAALPPEVNAYRTALQVLPGLGGVHIVAMLHFLGQGLDPLGCLQ